ncbi:pentapeptide repeat-containing protein [Pseudaminobacter arsenicus]|uniref:Pentapeptide repeat-containing protein n=1 Tax=Borborobacter arsenicus TaxID=1851146 RepID=A0A432V1P4_9HYPH|nr:pentapeptide repeat-containing protein [Pseudaminobacter arsenicus]
MLRSCPVGSVSAAARKVSVPVTLTLAFGLAFFTLIFAGWAEAVHCKSSPVAGLDWSHCNKSRLMLDGSNLESANLFSTDFSFTDLRDANLKSANLEKATLVRAWFTGANVVMANFARVEAYRANFAEVSAEGASFASAELQRVDFSRARLTGANFEKTELGRANFDEAVLRNTRFSFANLSRADFSSAIIKGPIEFDRAFLFLTRIEGLDLSDARGLQQPQIDAACGDVATKLPSGLSIPTTWPCRFD